MSKYGSRDSSVYLVAFVRTNVLRAVLEFNCAYSCPNALCSALVRGGKAAARHVSVYVITERKSLPSRSKEAWACLCWIQIQQSVQKYVWECPPKPLSLCAAGLSQTIARRITRTNRPEYMQLLWSQGV
jgi:hypothetical protein